MKAKIIAILVLGVLAWPLDAAGAKEAPAVNYTFTIQSETRNYSGSCTGTVWQMWDISSTYYFPGCSGCGFQRFQNATDACGNQVVNFSSGIPNTNPARYWYKAEGHLGRANLAWNYVQGGAHVVPALKAGDCHENASGIANNVVDVEDFNRLKAAYGWSVGQAGYVRACDFNADGTVEILDFSALQQNFGMSGDADICYIGTCAKPEGSKK